MERKTSRLQCQHESAQVQISFPRHWTIQVSKFFLLHWETFSLINTTWTCLQSSTLQVGMPYCLGKLILAWFRVLEVLQKSKKKRFKLCLFTLMGEMWKCSKKLSPDVSVSDASISSACSSCRSVSRSCNWNTNNSSNMSDFNPLRVAYVSRNCQTVALFYLLSVSLGVHSRCEQSQDGSQKTLIKLHCHLLNQCHEVPEVHTKIWNTLLNQSQFKGFKYSQRV